MAASIALRSAVTPVQISKDFAPCPTRNSSPSVAVAPAFTAAVAVGGNYFVGTMSRTNCTAWKQLGGSADGSPG